MTLKRASLPSMRGRRNRKEPMIEWLIDNKNLILGAAALAFPLALIDWRLRIRRKKMLQQQKTISNSRPEKGAKKKG